MSQSGLTYAEQVGCCLAPTKEACQRPPCPCNLDAWTEQEKRDLLAERRKARSSSNRSGA